VMYATKLRDNQIRESVGLQQQQSEAGRGARVGS